MFLSQISIGKRLTLVLGLILALFFASSVVAVVKLSQLGKEIDAMVNDNIKTERAGSDWLRHTTSGVQRAAAIAKSSDASLIPYFAPATAASIRDTNELQKFIESKMDTPEKKQHFAKVGDLRKDYLAAREEVSKFKQAGDAENANKVFTERFEPTSRSYLAGWPTCRARRCRQAQRRAACPDHAAAADLHRGVAAAGRFAGLAADHQHHAPAASGRVHCRDHRQHGPDGCPPGELRQ
jgi:hypothetical protein